MSHSVAQEVAVLMMVVVVMMTVAMMTVAMTSMTVVMTAVMISLNQLLDLTPVPSQIQPQAMMTIPI